MQGKLLTIFLALGLAGCATDRPLAIRCGSFDRFRIPVGETPGSGGDIGAATVGSPLVEVFAQSFPQTAAAGSEGSSSFLVLSGGGQWGAFGAGFLKGWSERGTGASTRPERFDVVTGVSTGALQATFAFLGRGQDQALLDAYSITNERQLVRRHGNLFFLNHASMADIGPLEGYLRTRLRPLLDQVAAPENAGRRLLVGAVDGLDGRMYAFDLTRMARELTGPEREDCYVGALLSSAAVPIVFRQVQVSGKPYLDGGVRQSVFVTEIQEAAGRALDAGARKGTIYVLMNGDVTPTRVAALPPKLLPTVNRLRSIVFNQVELSSVFAVASRFPGMTTKVATAAGHDCEAPQDEESEVFSPTVMACLRRYGQARWQNGDPWGVYHTPAHSEEH
ncbi:MAG: patatin-like phospholipase family protein [Sphingomonas phyllosphaerae]